MNISRAQLTKFLPDNDAVRIFEDAINLAERADASAGTVQKLPFAFTTTGLGDTGLQISVTANRTYKFEFVCAYDATAGTRFTLLGPAGTVFYRSEWALDASTSTVVNATAYSLPAGVNASVIGGVAKVEGFLLATASGVLKLQCQSSAPMTVRAGYSRAIALT